MHIFDTIFVIMVILQGFLCAPSPQSNGGYIKDVVSKKAWDFNGHVKPNLNLGIISLSPEVGINAEGHSNDNMTETLRPLHSQSPQQNNPYGMQPYSNMPPYAYPQYGAQTGPYGPYGAPSAGGYPYSQPPAGPYGQPPTGGYPYGQLPAGQNGQPSAGQYGQPPSG